MKSMAINIEVGDEKKETSDEVQNTLPESPKEEQESSTKLELNIRKSIEGNIIILDHEDIDIVIIPKENKIITFPQKTVKKYKTVSSALDDLPILKSGQRSVEVHNHQAMNHTDQMLKKMKYVKDGGSRLSIPAKLRPMSGDIRKYIRYNSNKPSVTITGDMRKVFHYSQNRALTVRELARLQSFDDDFIFEGNVISQQQQVGNSVPPLMAEAIAKKIKNMM